MIKQKCKRFKGLSLVEVLLAMTIIMVAALAAVGYRYSVALDTRKADEQMVASRLGLTLLEGWKGKAGRADFAPEVDYGSELAIATANNGPVVASGFNLLNHYEIVSDGVTYYTMLSSKDATATEPKMLNVHIAWLLDGQDGAASPDLIKSIRLTTYAGN